MAAADPAPSPYRSLPAGGRQKIRISLAIRALAKILNCEARVRFRHAARRHCPLLYWSAAADPSTDPFPNVIPRGNGLRSAGDSTTGAAGGFIVDGLNGYVATPGSLPALQQAVMARICRRALGSAEGRSPASAIMACQRLNPAAYGIGELTMRILILVTDGLPGGGGAEKWS